MNFSDCNLLSRTLKKEQQPLVIFHLNTVRIIIGVKYAGQQTIAAGTLVFAPFGANQVSHVGWYD